MRLTSDADTSVPRNATFEQARDTGAHAMKLQERSGILFPAKMRFRSWIVAGPPGAGKSYLIRKIGGWPGEVSLDITMNKWWAVEPLRHRPRELHFALPFEGLTDRYSVYAEQWSRAEERPKLDVERIRVPGKKSFFFSTDWRSRFVLDFILPPPAWLLGVRCARLNSDDFRLVDMNLTPSLVAWEVHIHWQLAWHLHQSGMQVMLRPFNTVRPFSCGVLERISRKEAPVSKRNITPSVSWSDLGNIRSWIKQSAAGRC